MTKSKIHKPPKHHAEQKPLSIEKGKNKKNLLIIALIALLAAIPFSMGKYIEFNSPGAYDSGNYVYSAAHIIDGAEIGVEEKPSAQLGTLMVNLLGVWMFGYNETGPEIIQMIMQAAALILMFIAARKLFGTLAAAVTVIVASIFLSSPLFAKFGNVKEQYMIACMVLGMSSFILYQLGGKWWWAVLAGAFLSWAPLFKPTGTTAIGAVGLFVILQPILKNRKLKQTAIDIALLFAGAAIALAPLYIWILGGNVRLSYPYKFAFRTVAKFIPSQQEVESAAKTAAAGVETASKKSGGQGYIARSWKMIPFSTLFPRVMRYYWLAILPIALALASLIARLSRMLLKILKPDKFEHKNYDRFVLLLAPWWILDMAFVWISPRSYEQYYLPLTASGAMLGGYIISLYYDKAKAAVFKTKWLACGIVGFALMIMMLWHVFFGIGTSPHSGQKYPQKRRGYTQQLQQIAKRRASNLKGPWEILGEYIRRNSSPDDKMYVWGWFPGIYVQAQRFAPTPYACMMPRSAPSAMKKRIQGMLSDFRKEPPKFIVDSRKNHIPLERPPYELWPRTKKGFLPPNKQLADRYDKQYAKMLGERFDEAEALRYEILKPLRDFIMQNYKIVSTFGSHVLFELKETKPAPEQG